MSKSTKHLREIRARIMEDAHKLIDNGMSHKAVSHLRVIKLIEEYIEEIEEKDII